MVSHKFRCNCNEREPQLDTNAIEYHQPKNGHIDFLFPIHSNQFLCVYAVPIYRIKKLLIALRKKAIFYIYFLCF